ncbi:hypothetical protein EJB05_02899, partial [Eragrostis curvula]
MNFAPSTFQPKTWDVLKNYGYLHGSCVIFMGKRQYRTEERVVADAPHRLKHPLTMAALRTSSFKGICGDGFGHKEQLSPTRHKIIIPSPDGTILHPTSSVGRSATTGLQLIPANDCSSTCAQLGKPEAKHIPQCMEKEINALDDRLVQLLLGIQEDVLEAVLRQGHRLGLAIRGRTPRPRASSSRSRDGGTDAATSNQRSDDRTILLRRQRRSRRQAGRGLLGGHGAGAVLPPVLAVLGRELVGERPVLGAVEGVELQQAAPAPAEDLLPGQRRGEAELRVPRRAGELHRRAGRRRRRRLVHGMGWVAPRL